MASAKPGTLQEVVYVLSWSMPVPVGRHTHTHTEQWKHPLCRLKSKPISKLLLYLAHGLEHQWPSVPLLQSSPHVCVEVPSRSLRTHPSEQEPVMGLGESPKTFSQNTKNGLSVSSCYEQIFLSEFHIQWISQKTSTPQRSTLDSQRVWAFRYTHVISCSIL